MKYKRFFTLIMIFQMIISHLSPFPYEFRRLYRPSDGKSVDLISDVHTFENIVIHNNDLKNDDLINAIKTLKEKNNFEGDFSLDSFFELFSTLSENSLLDNINKLDEQANFPINIFWELWNLDKPFDFGDFLYYEKISADSVFIQCAGKKLQNQKGFSLIELLVVVVIIAILAAIAVPIYMSYVRQARSPKHNLLLPPYAKLSEFNIKLTDLLQITMLSPL